MANKLSDDYLKINERIDGILEKIFKIAQPRRNNLLANNSSEGKPDYVFLKEISKIEAKHKKDDKNKDNLR